MRSSDNLFYYGGAIGQETNIPETEEDIKLASEWVNIHRGMARLTY